MRRERDPRRSLLVRHLKLDTTVYRVKEVFSKLGEVRDVYLPLDYHTKKPRGFGFVEFVEEKDAIMALKNMNGATVDGAQIQVTIAQEGRKSPDSMRTRDSHSQNFSSDRGMRHPSPRYSQHGDRFRERFRDFERRDRNPVRDEKSGREHYHGRPTYRDDRVSDRDRSYDYGRDDRYRRNYRSRTPDRHYSGRRVSRDPYDRPMNRQADYDRKPRARPYYKRPNANPGIPRWAIVTDDNENQPNQEDTSTSHQKPSDNSLEQSERPNMETEDYNADLDVDYTSYSPHEERRSEYRSESR